MAPPHSRHLLAWTLPTAVVLLSYLWYKRKRIGARSDPGDNKSPTHKEEVFTDKSLEEELKEADEHDSSQSSPNKTFSRSLSGVESTPIDIIIPPELRATKSTPRIVSDEDLDLEIEKIKSMKNGALFPAKLDSPVTNKSKSSTYRDNKESKPKSKKNQKKEAGKMAQKDIAIVEEKLTSLKISKNKETPKKREHKHSSSKKDTEELQRQNSERDSANHSPSDVMLASPSLSSISDNHSEGSSDSGKGGSDVATPPASRTPGIDVSSNVRTLYEFVIPQSLVGKLIGRHGCFVTQIKDKTNALIIVRAHPTNNKMKLCLVEGTRTEIDGALKMVRDKFPAKRYPEITLEEVHLVPEVPTVSLISDHLYLKLVEGVNNDTVLSCLVAPNHLFLQQPTHPSYPSLNLLTNCMNACYTQSESPLLPTPIPENTICAAFSVNAWYRAMVLSSDDESSYVKFLDYGGFAYVDNSQLRQIRGDFMLLPFQAAECMLANIKSVNEDGSWPEEAYNLIADVAKGSIMYTQVADYTEDGLPLVLIYAVIGSQGVVFLNQHLVDNGYAVWLQQTDTQTHRQEITEGAVGGITA
ncbi:KH domain-containing protein akap-1 [Diabrotica virgifera virgifera]|uniref:KH domain-containing protein akap-1 n=1 Tax=Diabrotica virgifera virgifera TaxID=50390 RepID=A0A6P7F9Z7_DIAVI|nr:KH domain-containing protein akap-1 [Diabrotica virgifera virgifera]XP_028130292.1 KH domain-containing protein akap-1 [Diabrotica virgifera virgifera]XP_028130295.1 KH domain-containing protein akap-1 [Diabrotica virgifera virgifera]XP_050502147.1 KH domain-containing protein akap-1 [Diabrotica virgifera virgifera]